MELHQLRYFVAVAETGGFCKAAKVCNVAQPSLSQQVRRLEELLGTRLFDRLARRTVLTDAGRELLPRARRILTEVREAHQELSSTGGSGTTGRTARLAIGAIPTIAPFVLPSVLAQLHELHSGCELVIREDYTERVISAVAEAELDVAIVATMPDDSALIAEPLGVDHFLLAAPRGHSLAGREGVALAELEGEPFVVLDEVHCLGRQVGELCRSRRVRPKVVSTITQLATALSMVESGLGVTIIPRLCVAAARGLMIETVPLKGVGASRDVVAVWRRGRSRPLAGSDLEAVVAAVVAKGARATSGRAADAVNTACS